MGALNIHLIIITRFFVHGGVATEYKKKRFVLNNASFMFIVCYIYAICFKQIFLISISKVMYPENLKKTMSGSIHSFHALNILATPRKIVNN